MRCTPARLALSRSRRSILIKMDTGSVAKVSPGEFIRQVRSETSKVVWPTGRETMMTVVMVIIMTTILGIFFLGVDSFFSWIVKSLLGLAGS
jgi:preprotein translocase subunit SecE